MTVQYVRFVCDKGKPIADAQLQTCLSRQNITTMGDETQEDRDTKMMSVGVKFVRWLTRPLSSPADSWVFFVDDDTWVFPAAVERVAQFYADHRKPVAVTRHVVACWGKIGNTGSLGGWKNVPHSSTFWERAVDLFNPPNGLLVNRHGVSGGAGMLCSPSCVALLRKIVHKLPMCACAGADRPVRPLPCRRCDAWAVEINKFLCGQESLVSCISQDHVMKILLPAVKDVIHHVQLHSQSLVDRKGNQLVVPTNTWNTVGTRVGSGGSLHKAVCDLNCAVPKDTDKSFDTATAVSLATSNTAPNLKSRQHAVPGQANLMTWHRFKSPEMFHKMLAQLHANSSDDPQMSSKE